jgi:hypothetical protein
MLVGCFSGQSFFFIFTSVFEGSEVFSGDWPLIWELATYFSWQCVVILIA